MSMGILSGVKSWMSFIGWTDGGSPGSTKLDADKKTIARHGDATWVKDVQDCCDRVIAEQARADIERRGALTSHKDAT